MTGLLILVGLILVILNTLSIRKQKGSFNGVLGNALENTHDYDIRLGEIRREFAESIAEMQSELMNIKDDMKKNNILNEKYATKLGVLNYNLNKTKEQSISTYSEDDNHREDNEFENKVIVDEPITSNNSNSAKIEGIKKLFNDGLDLDEISEILHLGKGEVLLIKDLYIK